MRKNTYEGQEQIDSVRLRLISDFLSKNQVMKYNLTHSESLLTIYLMINLNENGEALVTQIKMAEQTGIVRGSVNRSITKLSQKGIIVKRKIDNYNAYSFTKEFLGQLYY